MAWKDDNRLMQDLNKYVKQNFKRSEILDFMTRDFPEYKWSLPTLDRRFRHFDITYVERDTPLQTVKDAIQKELDGPGKLLGYRAMNQRLRNEHDIKVPRHLVYNVMCELDPEGMEDRCPKKKAKRAKKPFVSRGPLWVVSVDGHDKLCGYQNWTFPLGIYGFIDTFSRKMLSLSVVFSNSDPLVIGKLYLDLLYNTRMVSRFLRMDKGTETGKMAAMHTYVMAKNDLFDESTDSIVYGPSTTNKIERWWRDYHERFEKYFKVQLKSLLDARDYDPVNEIDRQMLAYIFIPIIQRENEIFVDMWNSHRIREQANLELPTGIPNHMFEFPEKYGAHHMGTDVTVDQLREVAQLSGVLGGPANYMDNNLRLSCEQTIPNPENIECKNAADAYLFLKRNRR